MAIYLVDFENVKSDGLKGIANLTNADKVFIFYSVNCDKITISLHSAINNSKASVQFVDVTVGSKNALDFQLASFLGYKIKENEKEEFVIVSHDNGFNYICKFWSEKGYTVSLVADLLKSNIGKITNDLYEKVSKYVEVEEEAKLLTDYILKYKTKQGLNNAIVKVYGTTKGGKLYNSIKPLIHDKKGK